MSFIGGFGMEKQIGDYILTEQISDGSCAQIYQATHIPTGEKVAIKVINKLKLRSSDDFSQKTEKEIFILKKMFHKNIIKLYEIMETSQRLYLVMELCDGGDLFNYISNRGHLSERQSCKFFHEIIEAISYLHLQQIAHRDIKPENLLLNTAGKSISLKLIDFGISKQYNGNLLETSCGTSAFAAPEIYRGGKYNPLLCDIWSSGIVLYAMIFGYLPFGDEDEQNNVKNIIRGDYEIPDEASDDLRDLLTHIIEIDPNKRYNLDQIKNHKWYNIVKVESIPGIIVDKHKIPIDDRIVNVCHAYGYEEDKIIESVSENYYDNNTSIYYIILNKFIRERYDSISDLFSQDYLDYINNPNNLIGNNNEDNDIDDIEDNNNNDSEENINNNNDDEKRSEEENEKNDDNNKNKEDIFDNKSIEDDNENNKENKIDFQNIYEDIDNTNNEKDNNIEDKNNENKISNDDNISDNKNKENENEDENIYFDIYTNKSDNESEINNNNNEEKNIDDEVKNNDDEEKNIDDEVKNNDNNEDNNENNEDNNENIENNDDNNEDNNEKNLNYNESIIENKNNDENENDEDNTDNRYGNNNDDDNDNEEKKEEFKLNEELKENKSEDKENRNSYKENFENNSKNKEIYDTNDKKNKNNIEINDSTDDFQMNPISESDQNLRNSNNLTSLNYNINPKNEIYSSSFSEVTPKDINENNNIENRNSINKEKPKANVEISNISIFIKSQINTLNNIKDIINKNKYKKKDANDKYKKNISKKNSNSDRKNITKFKSNKINNNKKNINNNDTLRKSDKAKKYTIIHNRNTSASNRRNNKNILELNNYENNKNRKLKSYSNSKTRNTKSRNITYHNSGRRKANNVYRNKKPLQTLKNSSRFEQNDFNENNNNRSAKPVSKNREHYDSNFSLKNKNGKNRPFKNKYYNNSIDLNNINYSSYKKNIPKHYSINLPSEYPNIKTNKEKKKLNLLSNSREQFPSNKKNENSIYDNYGKINYNTESPCLRKNIHQNIGIKSSGNKSLTNYNLSHEKDRIKNNYQKNIKRNCRYLNYNSLLNNLNSNNDYYSVNRSYLSTDKNKSKKKTHNRSFDPYTNKENKDYYLKNLNKEWEKEIFGFKIKENYWPKVVKGPINIKNIITSNSLEEIIKEIVNFLNKNNIKFKRNNNEFKFDCNKNENFFEIEIFSIENKVNKSNKFFYFTCVTKKNYISDLKKCLDELNKIILEKFCLKKYSYSSKKNLYSS